MFTFTTGSGWFLLALALPSAGAGGAAAQVVAQLLHHAIGRRSWLTPAGAKAYGSFIALCAIGAWVLCERLTAPSQPSPLWLVLFGLGYWAFAASWLHRQPWVQRRLARLVRRRRDDSWAMARLSRAPVAIAGSILLLSWESTRPWAAGLGLALLGAGLLGLWIQKSTAAARSRPAAGRLTWLTSTRVWTTALPLGVMAGMFAARLDHAMPAGYHVLLIGALVAIFADGWWRPTALTWGIAKPDPWRLATTAAIGAVALALLSQPEGRSWLAIAAPVGVIGGLLALVRPHGLEAGRARSFANARKALAWGYAGATAVMALAVISGAKAVAAEGLDLYLDTLPFVLMIVVTWLVWWRGEMRNVRLDAVARYGIAVLMLVAAAIAAFEGVTALTGGLGEDAPAFLRWLESALDAVIAWLLGSEEHAVSAHAVMLVAALVSVAINARVAAIFHSGEHELERAGFVHSIAHVLSASSLAIGSIAVWMGFAAGDALATIGVAIAIGIGGVVVVRGGHEHGDGSEPRQAGV